MVTRNPKALCGTCPFFYATRRECRADIQQPLAGVGFGYPTTSATEFCGRHPNFFVTERRVASLPTLEVNYDRAD